MVYYKIVYQGIVIDALDRFVYVGENPRNKSPVIVNDKENAMGILASDGSEFWHIAGLQEFTGGEYKTVEVVEIGGPEYDALRAELEAGKEIAEPTENAENKAPVASKATMAETVAQLVDQVQALTKRNEFLEDCLLEMSEAVYGGD